MRGLSGALNLLATVLGSAFKFAEQVHTLNFVISEVENPRDAEVVDFLLSPTARPAVYMLFAVVITLMVVKYLGVREPWTASNMHGPPPASRTAVTNEAEYLPPTEPVTALGSSKFKVVLEETRDGRRRLTIEEG